MELQKYLIAIGPEQGACQAVKKIVKLYDAEIVEELSGGMIVVEIDSEQYQHISQIRSIQAIQSVEEINN